MTRYSSPAAVPPEAISGLKAAYIDAAGGDRDKAFEQAVTEVLFLLPGISSGLLRIALIRSKEK